MCVCICMYVCIVDYHGCVLYVCVYTKCMCVIYICTWSSYQYILIHEALSSFNMVATAVACLHLHAPWIAFFLCRTTCCSGPVSFSRCDSFWPHASPLFSTPSSALLFRAPSPAAVLVVAQAASPCHTPTHFCHYVSLLFLSLLFGEALLAG